MKPGLWGTFRSSEEDEQSFGMPRIVIVGCGGAGSNVVSRLARIDLEGAKTVAINTDRQHLKTVKADKKILMGEKLTGCLGTGGDIQLGRKAAVQAVTKLEDLLDGADMVFVTAELGGGTGTGSAIVVARLAKQKGAIVVAMVTTPVHMKRARVLAAEEGLEALRACADTLIVLDNNRLLDCAPDLPLEEAFSVVDQNIAEIIKGLTEILTQPSQINLDFADVRTIMSAGGASFIFVGEENVKRGPEMIVGSVLKNPMMEVDYRGAKACLLHMTGGPDLTLKEAAAIAGALTQELDLKANVIWGARIRPDYEGRVRLVAIITGVRSAQVLGPLERSLEETPAREEPDSEKYARIEVIK